MGPRHSKVVGVEGVGDGGGAMSMRSPPWSYRLKEPSSTTCFCPPLSHSVTLIKIPPAVGLGFPTFPPFLYSAVTIRLGATREFAGGKVRAWWFQPLGLPPSSPWPAETGREQGSPSGSQLACTLGYQTPGGSGPAGRPCSGWWAAGAQQAAS